MTLFFESFMVFYLLEILFLIYIIIYFYYKPKVIQKSIWDPLGLQQTKGSTNVRKSRRKQKS